MTSRQDKLRIKYASVRFPLARSTVTALDNVSLNVPAGQFCAVVGPSGCGKSTLLRVIAGLAPLTSGNVNVDRETGDKPLQSMVFQGRSVFPWMTVLENAA
jgi:NitT/TauT family transport system ATP-binding protein